MKHLNRVHVRTSAIYVACGMDIYMVQVSSRLHIEHPLSVNNTYGILGQFDHLEAVVKQQLYNVHVSVAITNTRDLNLKQ